MPLLKLSIMDASACLLKPPLAPWTANFLILRSLSDSGVDLGAASPSRTITGIVGEDAVLSIVGEEPKASEGIVVTPGDLVLPEIAFSTLTLLFATFKHPF